MAVQIAGNLKELIEDGAARYIALNPNKFKSTTPGPVGPDGPRGPQGVGVHHMKGTSTTDPEGDFSTAGELDTYTFYADANEVFPLAWFTVKNGEDPWRRAVDRGYRGTEEEFYTLLASVEEYATIALESINITEENKQFVIAQAQIVAADKLIVEQSMNTTISNREQAELLLKYTNSILLGNKDADPLVDNNGDALIIGSMYYNTTENALKVWSGTNWFATTFTFNGRAGEVVLLNSDVTAATGVDLQTKVPEIDDRLDANESDVSDLGQRVGILEGDITVVGSVDNTIELRAQDAIYDDDNALGADTIKEALDKLVLDFYKVKEW